MPVQYGFHLFGTDPIPARVLTMFEFEAIYDTTSNTIRRMIERKQLQAFRVGKRWFIVDPGPTAVQMARDQAVSLDSVAFIRPSEVAQVLHLSSRRVRQLTANGTLEARWTGSKHVYALADVLKFGLRRERLARASKGHGEGPYIRREVIAWASRRLAETVTSLPQYSEISLADLEPRLTSAIERVVRCLSVNILSQGNSSRKDH
jgi:hypothetical protein